MLIDVRNVHQALPEGCYRMATAGYSGASRNGRVMRFDGPCTTAYRKPLERVEFHPERDSNPFFHLMESLWMLGGRNDVAFVSQYSSNIAQFSDDGVKFNGAYGYRWRRWFGHDQLKLIVAGLRDNPDCRRQVLAMWDGEEDIACRAKDIPCNTTAYFQRSVTGRLDLFVCNRSNDMIWGAYGANAVHFSVLLEYVAAALGWLPGTYYQISANTHVYERHWPMMGKLAEKAVMPPDKRTCPYSQSRVRVVPLVRPRQESVEQLDEDISNILAGGEGVNTLFCREVVAPMVRAWTKFKERENPLRHQNAIDMLASMPPLCDWECAARAWLERRCNS